MSIAEQINQDLITAMKAKDQTTLTTLRLVKAAVSNFLIERKKDAIQDSELIDILHKQAKQRRESCESYEKAKRKDLFDKEKEELEILQKYLPKQLSDDEIETFVKKAIESSQAKSKADIGKVMKELMPSVKGKADGKRVNEIVGRLLESL